MTELYRSTRETSAGLMKPTLLVIVKAMPQHSFLKDGGGHIVCIGHHLC
jgi:hypothetical protein